ncbi:MAG: hypothetical protein HDR06_17100 [Lachnospiraceae bacterium]|nr:hypothetical protein [Lachnospiraceae bacterium]
MDNSNSIFVWSDGWWLENDNAWFVSGVQNILFCLDLNMYKCEYVMAVPSMKATKNRCNPLCIKLGNDIYCMPDKGRSVWIYNVDNCKLRELEINNPNDVRLQVYGFWDYDNRIYAVSYGLKKIIEIDISRKKILNYYNLDGEGVIADSIKIKNRIYILYESGRVCTFDMKTREDELFTLPNIERKLYKFCFDVDRFWITGYRNEIYIWYKEKNTLSVLDSFPEDFGIYNFLDSEVDKAGNNYQVFEYTVTAGHRVWFIPYNANEIIYADKERQELHAFRIEEEIETEKSLLENEMGEKYRLEYVKGERYIGLFSFKNNRVLEIDAKELKYKWCDYYFSDECIKKCADILGNLYHEKVVFERLIHSRISQIKCKDMVESEDTIGKKIYSEIL